MTFKSGDCVLICLYCVGEWKLWSCWLQQIWAGTMVLLVTVEWAGTVVLLVIVEWAGTVIRFVVDNECFRGKRQNQGTLHLYVVVIGNNITLIQ